MIGCCLEWHPGCRCGEGLDDFIRVLLGEALGVFAPEIMHADLQVMQRGLVAIKRGQRVEKGEKADARDRGQKNPCVR